MEYKEVTDIKRWWIGLLCILLCVPWLSVQSSAEEEIPCLRVGVYEEAPYQFFTSEGEAQGLLVEVFTAVATNCGYQVEYLPFLRLVQCVQALEAGEIDLVLGMPSYNNFNLNESVELYSSQMVLIGANTAVKPANTQDWGLSVGYDIHTVPESILYRIGATQYVVSSQQNALLEYQQEGQADAVIVDALIAEWFFGQRKDLSHQVLNDFLDTIRYTIAVAPTHRTLLRELNTGILEFRLSGDYSDLIRRWETPDPARRVVYILRWVIVLLGVCVASALGYILIGFKLRRMLQQEVDGKTIELQYANETLARRYEELKFDDELRRQIIENSSNGLVLADRDFQVQLMNRSAARLAHVGPLETGLVLTELPRFRELIAQLRSDLFDSTQAQSLTFAIETPSGQRETFLGSVHPMFCNHEVIGALFSLEDITFEIQAAQRNFEREKNHILNRMIAGIAHEIKNPLMSIRTYASLLQQKIDDPSFRASFSEFVPRESDRINQLVESLVNYAKPIQGEQIHTDLFALVQDCVYLSEVARRNPHIRFEIQVEGACMIFANPNQIKQSLINMIINGMESIERKHADCQTPMDSLLRVTARIDGDDGAIEIYDEGVGMSDYMREHCIDPFYTTKQRGSGLGLALSSQYIQENGGSLEIESQEGRYTCMKLRFRRVLHEA